MKVRSRHNSNRRTLQIVVTALVVIGVGLLLPRLLSTVATVVMTPVHAVNVWLEESTSLVPTFIRDRQALATRIAELEQELVVANRTDLTQQRLWEENNRLRQLLGATDETRVAAAVIARPQELPYDLLQIDRGSAHGITVGSPVFIGEDIVIGLVTHTAAHYSFVALITTPGFEATAFIAGPNIAVTLEGVGGGVARVRVPQGIPLTVGDLVYLLSIEPGTYGRISHVENEPTQPEQYGYISPDISIASLYQVAVGTQSQIIHATPEVEARMQELIASQLVIEDLPVISLATSTATTSDDTATTSPDTAAP